MDHLHDLAHFNQRLKAAVERVNKLRPYKMESLGKVDGADIFLLAPQTLDNSKPNILSAGGFHGEEPAGPWGILEYLETATAEELTSVNHSFLPLVNPTGFSKGQRLNTFGENPNRGFVPELLDHEKGATGNNDMGPSVEGLLLLDHIDWILTLAKDGFVSQHEDADLHQAFVFINEQLPQPSPFAKIFLDAMQQHVGVLPDGGIEGNLEDDAIKDGVWHNDLDGSFEGYLTRRGIPRCATTETPGKKPAADRINCNREMTRAFAKFSKDLAPAPAPKSTLAKKPTPPKMG